MTPQFPSDVSASWLLTQRREAGACEGALCAKADRAPPPGQMARLGRGGQHFTLSVWAGAQCPVGEEGAAE